MFEFVVGSFIGIVLAILAEWLCDHKPDDPFLLALTTLMTPPDRPTPIYWPYVNLREM